MGSGRDEPGILEPLRPRLAAPASLSLDRAIRVLSSETAPNDACGLAVLVSLDLARRALGSLNGECAPPMLTEEACAHLPARTLAPLERRQAIALVDECYRSLSRMLDNLERSVTGSSAPEPLGLACFWRRPGTQSPRAGVARGQLRRLHVVRRPW